MRSRKHAKPITAEGQASLSGPHRAREGSPDGTADDGCPAKTYPTSYFRYPSSARRRAPIRYAR